MFKKIILACLLAISPVAFSASTAVDNSRYSLGGYQGTNWSSYSPTWSSGFGTVTAQSIIYRRVGDSLEVMGKFTTGSVTTGIGSVTLPSGLAIDTGKITTTNTSSAAGTGVGWWVSNGGSQRNGTIVTALGTATDRVYFGWNISNSNMLVPATNVNSNLISSDESTLYFRVPISGWAAGGEGLQNESHSAMVAGASISSACSSSPCTVYLKSDNWVSSVTRSSTGTYTINFVTGTFSASPICVFSEARGGPSNVAPDYSAVSSTSITLNSWNAAGGAGADSAFTVSCRASH